MTNRTKRQILVRSVFMIVIMISSIGSNSISFAISGNMPGDNSYTNSIGMKFVKIEAGNFTMGETATQLPYKLTRHRGTQAQGDFDEKPVHQVTITKPFFTGVCEVTNKQYESFDPEHKKLRGKEGLSIEDDEAVIFVNWYQAKAFCEWLSDKEQMPYRLPTEAEWEYACRAGTTSPFHTRGSFPEKFHKNQSMIGTPIPVGLHVGKTAANRWGLYDMHGNVEEWCSDWYGPYKKGKQKDPVGYIDGDFKVTRGGSHATELYYLRSANRMGTLAANKHWLIGFRVVIGAMPKTKPLPLPEVPMNQQNVQDRARYAINKGPDPDKPFFKGPRKFVRIRKEANGPIFAGHNHCPAIVECPNGDLLTIWYTGIGERERNMAVAASRLIYGTDQWQQASEFWDPPDRNDTALALWYDDEDTLYHFNSLSISSNWARMAVIMRTSQDSGKTWSKARLILNQHTHAGQISEPVISLQDGSIVITHDGGRTLYISKDKGLTWNNPAGDIAGIHPGVAQLDDGSLLGYGRGGQIDGQMIESRSYDRGNTFHYSPSGFNPIGGGQRLVLLKLRKGPLFFASFANQNGISTIPAVITDSEGNKHRAHELFAAVSFDGGKTWPHKRVVTDDKGPHPVECTDGGVITLNSLSSEHRGYMSVCQSIDGLIHLITSRQHYSFNLKWLTTAPPPPGEKLKVTNETETFDGGDFDLDGWSNYKSYTGGFNNKGQYTINSIMPYGGLNKTVGTGSFDATFAMDNLSFHPGLRGGEMSVGFKDKFCRTWFLIIKPDHINIYFKDVIAGEKAKRPRPEPVKYEKLPKSLKARFTFDEKTGRCRVYYGLNGEEPINEMPQSKAGLHMAEPFSESNAAYILITEGIADMDQFSIKPLE